MSTVAEQGKEFAAMTCAQTTATAFSTARKGVKTAIRQPRAAVRSIATAVSKPSAANLKLASTLRRTVAQPVCFLGLLKGFKGVGVHHTMAVSAAAVLEAGVHRRLPVAGALAVGLSCAVETAVYRGLKLPAQAKGSFTPAKAVQYAALAGVAAFAATTAVPAAAAAGRGVARQGLKSLTVKGLGQGLKAAAGPKFAAKLGMTTIQTVVWWGAFEASTTALNFTPAITGMDATVAQATPAEGAKAAQAMRPIAMPSSPKKSTKAIKARPAASKALVAAPVTGLTLSLASEEATAPATGFTLSLASEEATADSTALVVGGSESVFQSFAGDVGLAMASSEVQAGLASSFDAVEAPGESSSLAIVPVDA